ncbi:MAG: ABC transporter permease [Deltaproteobacteria bacterium]
MKYELRVGWRYLYSGQHDRAMRNAAIVAALVAITGLFVMLTSHGASPIGVLMLVLGMIAAAVCTLLAVFSVFMSVSVLGVVLGVSALTIVLAVTTGFQRQFRDKVLGVNAHVIVMKVTPGFAEYRDVMETARHIDPDVLAVQPFIFAEMLATRGKGKVAGVGIKGVDPVLVKGVLDLDKHMEEGSIGSLGAPRKERELPPVILGKQLALTLEANLGDDVTVVVGMTARTMHFRVTGIFYSGFDEYDSHLMYAALADIQALIGRGDQVMGVEMKVKDVTRAEAIGKHLQHALGDEYDVQDWHHLNENLFAALTFQKLALVIILTLIIIVATVNMVSALTMMVTDKTREIAILKSMGSTSSSVARVFLVLGLAIGGVGTLLGVGIGLATCYATSAYGYHLDPKVYLIDRLPIDVQSFEVVLVAGITLVISLIATLPPSRNAAALTPVEGLRYD